MSKLDILEDEFWQELAEQEHDAPLPCMDAAIDLIDEKDYYGCDFSGDRQVVQIFFTGSSDYFPAAWLGNASCSNIEEQEDIDEYPIYVFELSSNDNDLPIDCVGNLKTYLLTLLDFVNNNKMRFSEKLVLKACELRKTVQETLSDNLVHSNPYNLKINE